MLYGFDSLFAWGGRGKWVEGRNAARKRGTSRLLRKFKGAARPRGNLTTCLRVVSESPQGLGGNKPPKRGEWVAALPDGVRSWSAGDMLRSPLLLGLGTRRGRRTLPPHVTAQSHASQRGASGSQKAGVRGTLREGPPLRTRARRGDDRRTPGPDHCSSTCFLLGHLACPWQGPGG